MELYYYYLHWFSHSYFSNKSKLDCFIYTFNYYFLFWIYYLLSSTSNCFLLSLNNFYYFYCFKLIESSSELPSSFFNFNIADFNFLWDKTTELLLLCYTEEQLLKVLFLIMKQVSAAFLLSEEESFLAKADVSNIGGSLQLNYFNSSPIFSF